MVVVLSGTCIAKGDISRLDVLQDSSKHDLQEKVEQWQGPVTDSHCKTYHAVFVYASGVSRPCIPILLAELAGNRPAGIALCRLGLWHGCLKFDR